jgi:hypothetical protein
VVTLFESLQLENYFSINQFANLFIPFLNKTILKFKHNQTYNLKVLNKLKPGQYGHQKKLQQPLPPKPLYLQPKYQLYIQFPILHRNKPMAKAFVFMPLILN